MDDRDVKLGERIRDLATARGWTLAELARRSGIKPESLSRTVKAKNRPLQTTLRRIADALGVSVEELFKVEEDVERKSATSVLSELEKAVENAKRYLVESNVRGEVIRSDQPEPPVLGHVGAGTPWENEQQGVDEVPVTILQGRSESYQLIVDGNSLEGPPDYIRNGDSVEVMPAKNLKHDGDLCVVLLDGHQVVLRHVWHEKDGRVRLASTNMKFADLYPEQMEIQGRVIGWYHRNE